MKNTDICDRWGSYYLYVVFKWDTLPSMPMSSRLDVSGPQFLWACCLLIQFQLKPRKSRTIFFPTVSFKVCCKYTLQMKKKRNTQNIWNILFYTRWDCSMCTVSKVLVLQITSFKLWRNCIVQKEVDAVHLSRSRVYVTWRCLQNIFQFCEGHPVCKQGKGSDIWRLLPSRQVEEVCMEK